MVEVLLKVAAKAVTMRDIRGKTPLDVALDRVKQKKLSADDPLVTMLKEAGGWMGGCGALMQSLAASKFAARA